MKVLLGINDDVMRTTQQLSITLSNDMANVGIWARLEVKNADLTKLFPRRRFELTEK